MFGIRFAVCWLACALLLTSCSASVPGTRHTAEEQPRTALKVLYGTSEIGSEAVIDAARRYERLTGTPVEVSTFGYDNLQGKVMSELTRRSGEYDLVAMDASWTPLLLPHIEPLSEYIRGSQGVFAEDVALNDFIPKVFFDASVFDADKPQRRWTGDGEILLGDIAAEGFDVFALPIHVNAAMGTYRKDLFRSRLHREAFVEQYGRELGVPLTIEQYSDIARYFTGHARGDGTSLYGTTLMAARSESNVVEFLSFLGAYGGELLDSDLRAVFHREEGVEALEEYGRWLNAYKIAPPEALSFTWEEAAIVFGSGQTAMGLNYHEMELNPKIRGGETGYFPFPGTEREGEVRRGPQLTTWGLGVNKYSGRKEEAFRLLAYLTGKETQSQSLRFKHHVTRFSAYEQTASLLIAADREYYGVLGQSLEIGVVRPRLVRYSQVSDVLQGAIRDYLIGQGDARIVLRDAAERVDAIVRQELQR